MEAIGFYASVIIKFCLVMLLIGLWKPWVVLWWLDHKNRLKVIIYYGAAILLALIAKTLVE